MASSLLTIEEARLLVGAFVYGLVDDRGLFYVGQTRRPKQRFRAHLECRHNNRQLRGRIMAAGENLRVTILHENPQDLNAAELYEIKTRPGLVNLVGTDAFSQWTSGRKRATPLPPKYGPAPRRPWQAGRKDRSPGEWALRQTKEGATSPIRRLLAQMSDARRCAYELQLLSELHPIIRRRFDGWLASTRDRMLACMEAA